MEPETINIDIYKKIFGEEWFSILKDFVLSPKFGEILQKTQNKEAEGITVYPPRNKIFRIFRELPPSEVKVVWLCQDPYHNGQATGIATGIEGGYIPPTLRIMEQEYKQYFKNSSMDHSLYKWVKSGVFMFNRSLTVEKGSPNSHKEIWEEFTRLVLERLSLYNRNIVYVLLGKEAQTVEPYLFGLPQIIKLPHPVSEVYRPGSGFLGSDIYREINRKLSSISQLEVQWT